MAALTRRCYPLATSSAGNLFGMIAPIATGCVINATGSYDWAFGIAGILLLVGATVVLTMTRSPMTDDRSASTTRVAV